MKKWICLFLIISINASELLAFWGPSWENKRGAALLNQGKTKKAIMQFETAISKYPEYLELYYNLGQAYYRNEDYEKARFAYLHAEKDKNKKASNDARYNLGNSYFKMNAYEQAIKAYQSVLLEIPKDKDAKYNLELAQKKLKEQSSNKETDKDKDTEEKRSKTGRKGSQKKKKMPTDPYKENISILQLLDEKEKEARKRFIESQEKLENWEEQDW